MEDLRGRPEPVRIVVGISAATGAILGVRVLERLAAMGVETHLVISKWARQTIELETDRTAAEVEALASAVYRHGEQSAAISSGSFRTDGMIVAPCSVRSAAAIAHGLADNLLVRAADVTLKERRPLVLMVRETPLSQVHLSNLLTLASMGVSVCPPMPAFYNHPQSIDDLLDHVVGRALDQLGLADDNVRRWDGSMRRAVPASSPRRTGAVASALPGSARDPRGLDV